MKYVMICAEGIHVIIDHKTLLSTFHPLSVELTISCQKLFESCKMVTVS